MESLWSADKHNTERFISLQPEYSLISHVTSNFETELAASQIAELDKVSDFKRSRISLEQ